MITNYSSVVVSLLNIISTKYYRELEKYPILEKYVQRFLSSELMTLNQAETT